MAEILDAIHPVWLYSFIFFGKIIEVAMATVRIVLITKGEKILGATIGFFEVVLWVILAVTILTDITSDPMKVVVYALAFSLGNYYGTIIEDKLALGSVRVEAIVKKSLAKQMSIDLRAKGYGVTAVDAYGKDDRKEMIIMHISRKNTKKVIDFLKTYDEQMMITATETRPLYGGYGMLRK